MTPKDDKNIPVPAPPAPASRLPHSLLPGWLPIASPAIPLPRSPSAPPLPLAKMDSFAS